ncbi:MAG TPA: hypothetical protein VMZ22_07850, partial [Acidimicrobiales bacterium]|nr:hypothetical protein [Acidimicrobiales bacterium]
MSISKRVTKKGPRYDVRLRDAEGRPFKRTFRTRKEAETFQRATLTKRDRGGWIDPRNSVMRFAEVAAKWLDSNPSKKPGSRVRDEAALARWVLPTIGNRHVGAVRPEDVQGLINAWKAAGLAPGSVKRHYSVVHAIFAWAVDMEYSERSPCRKNAVKLPKSSVAPTHHVITPEELGQLVETLGLPYGLMALVGAVLGLRWGEVAGMRVGSVDFLRRTVTVAEAVSRDGHGTALVDTPKSEASQRVITAPAPLVELLAAHVASEGISEDRSALLFAQRARIRRRGVTPPESGNRLPLDYANFHRVWIAAVTAVGLPGPSHGRQKYFGFH